MAAWPWQPARDNRAMNDPVQTAAARWLAAGVGAVLVEVARTRGSAPRDAGTRMIVTTTEVAGTIGGGHLEWRAIADARSLLASGTDAAIQHVALGPSLGQCCGGSLDLRFERLTAAHLAAWPVKAPLFFLQLYGAGHVGRAIAAVLATLPCQVQWIDERETEFPPPGQPAAPHIERLCVEPVHAEVAQAPPGAFYLVLTHSHDLDFSISEAVLRRGDFAYFGLIGSKTKRERFVRRLVQRGVAPEAVTRMCCPIGVAGITGKEPAVVAVSVVAQLLQQARASGAPPMAGAG